MNLFRLALCIVSVVTTFLASSWACADSNQNVILLMLDGVRWQEVFNGVDSDLGNGDSGLIFHSLLQTYARAGTMIGSRNEMKVSNRAVMSLPAYLSIMSGRAPGCITNNCDRTKFETVQERILREFELDRKQVATIASWEKIPLAVEHIQGKTFVNAALQPLDDGANDPQTSRINEAQAKNHPPWSNARFDRYTFAHAMKYLEHHQPRFLFISLNDSDEWAHRGDYTKYIATLRQYDKWIAELIAALKQSGEYGRKTTLIVTTDHGRGEGSDWTTHGTLSEARDVWLYGSSPATRRRSIFSYVEAGYTHLDIRPTIEAAFGLAPIDCKACGHVIRGIIPGVR